SIMPDFDIFTDGPATVLAVLNLWIQISQTAGASGDWWHRQHRLIGRVPNGKNLDAGKAGVEVDDRGFIRVDKQLRTNVPHIFAIG
ncbi:FAD-dependent oxidoreductase, partial [Salmonella enterica subsp. enterica serovar Kentucky]|nr:FAD-dependent oxidoreductase [Salmonella enterica subsp. enterica serovar Kentucky]